MFKCEVNKFWNVIQTASDWLIGINLESILVASIFNELFQENIKVLYFLTDKYAENRSGDLIKITFTF